MGLFDFLRRQPAQPPEVRIEPPLEAPSPAPQPRASVQEAGGGVLITTPDQLEAYLRQGAGGTASGERVTPDTALSVGAVFACVRIIAGAVATLPLDVKRRIDERTREDASDHPVYRILRRKPNRWMKPAAFRRMAQAHLLLRGKHCSRIVRGVRGDAQELLPLNPDRVTVEQQPDLSLRFRYRRPDGGETVFGQDEIFYLIGMTLDGVNGVSVLTYARETIGLALATRKHGAGFFRNGTKVGSWIKHPGKVGKEGLEFLQASLDAYRSGGEREGKSLVLEEGAEFHDMGMTMVDAAFIDTLGLTRTDIAMFFGVPPHMIGDTNKSTSWGTGIEQQSLGFVAYTLEDWLTGWEDAVNVDLITEREPQVYARFNRAALVKGDIKTRWNAYVQSLQWGVNSPNEIRALEDQNPREGGDIYYPPPNTAGDQQTAEERDDEPQNAPRD